MSLLRLTLTAAISPRPVVAVTFGATISDRAMVTRGMRSELAGLAICVVVGTLIGAVALLFNVDSLPTQEMEVRSPSSPCMLSNLIGATSPPRRPQSRGLWSGVAIGVSIAIPSGVGVALSVSGLNTSSLVGVAISASLLPPAVNAGICWCAAALQAGATVSFTAPTDPASLCLTGRTRWRTVGPRTEPTPPAASASSAPCPCSSPSSTSPASSSAPWACSRCAGARWGREEESTRRLHAVANTRAALQLKELGRLPGADLGWRREIQVRKTAVEAVRKGDTRDLRTKFMDYLRFVGEEERRRDLKDSTVPRRADADVVRARVLACVYAHLCAPSDAPLAMTQRVMGKTGITALFEDDVEFGGGERGGVDGVHTGIGPAGTRDRNTRSDEPHAEAPAPRTPPSGARLRGAAHHVVGQRAERQSWGADAMTPDLLPSQMALFDPGSRDADSMEYALSRLPFIFPHDKSHEA